LCVSRISIDKCDLADNFCFFDQRNGNYPMYSLWLAGRGDENGGTLGRIIDKGFLSIISIIWGR